MLNNRTKFGAKIFRRYQVITFYVLGHFLAAPDEAPACVEGTVATKEQFCFVLVDCIYLPYLAS